MHYKVEDIPGFIIQLYGITQDPETKNYMMVLDYAENGSLRNYLDKEYDELSWKIKFNNLWYVVTTTPTAPPKNFGNVTSIYLS